MQLWSDEIEQMRSEARKAVGDGFTARMAALITTGPLPADPLVRAQERRAMFDRLTVTEPGAIEREIAGVRCRVFLPAEPVKAVYLHFHGGGMVIGTPEMSDVG